MNAQRFAYKATNRRTVATIQKNAVKKGKRNMASRLIHKKSEKEAIVGWKRDLLRILQIFNVCPVSYTLRSLTVLPSDRVVDGYPFDTLGPPPPTVSRSGIR